MIPTDSAYRRAEKHVRNVRDFFYHLMVYVLVCALLVVVDRLGGANSGFAGLDFAHWVILGWGFGVAGHAVFVFFDDYMVRKRYAEERWRERIRH